MTGPLLLQVACLLLLIAPGYWLRRTGVLTEAGTTELAKLLMRAIYPCLIYGAVAGQLTTRQLVGLWPLPVLVFALMVLGFLVGLGAAGRLRFATPKQRQAFLFQCAFNNYSFLPMPLVAMLYGDTGVAMLIVSSLGAEIALWTLGFALMNRAAGLGWRSLRCLANPVLLMLAAAFVTLLVRDAVAPRVPAALAGIAQHILATLQMAGKATIPLSMVIAGSCIAVLPAATLREPRAWLAAGLRLLLIPALALLALRLLPLPAMDRQILSIVAVMPVALASITFAKVFQGDEDFVSGTVLLTHLLALVTIPLLLALAL